MSIFREYAWAYDLVYRDKPYAAEAEFVHDLLTALEPSRSPGEVTLLDLACGTARHAREWQRRGYRVEGSEPSAEMREVARSAAGGAALQVHPYGFEECRKIGRTFDVVTAMFGSIGYLTTQDAVTTGLANIADLVAPGGYFLFDHWSALAVPSQYSPVKALDIVDGQRSLHRVSRTTLDPFRSTAEVVFDVMLFESNRLVSRMEERHLVRYFTPNEMIALLDAAGFALERYVPFMAPGRAPTELDWNLTAIARKKDAPRAR